MGTLTNREEPDKMPHNHYAAFHQGLQFVKVKSHPYWKMPACDPLKYIMDNPKLIAFISMEESIGPRLSIVYALYINFFL